MGSVTRQTCYDRCDIKVTTSKKGKVWKQHLGLCVITKTRTVLNPLLFGYEGYVMRRAVLLFAFGSTACNLEISQTASLWVKEYMEGL